MKKNQKTIILASGGTGGHMFPAATLAEELISRKYKVILMTDERGNKLANKFPKDVDVYIIRAKTFKKGIISKIGTSFNLICGYFYALKILLKFNPDLLVSFGGYASFPSSFAASTIKVPIILHEQNALLGRTNRFMLPFANKLATSFHKVQKISKFYRTKIFFTGNPINKKIEKLNKNKYPSLEKINILITGGSQGAKIFSDVVPNAIKLLPKKERDKIEIVQQVINDDLEKVNKLYEKIKVKAEISPFFNDMDQKLKETNLFIGRAGAITINELMMVGRPSILIPLPTSMEDHQTINSNVIADAGAGWTMKQNTFTAEKLAERISYLIKNPKLLKTAGDNAKKLATVNAVRRLADLVEMEIKK